MKSSEFIEWQEILNRIIYRLLYTMNEDEKLQFLIELDCDINERLGELQGAREKSFAGNLPEKGQKS